MFFRAWLYEGKVSRDPYMKIPNADSSLPSSSAWLLLISSFVKISFTALPLFSFSTLLSEQMNASCSNHQDYYLWLVVRKVPPNKGLWTDTLGWLSARHLPTRTYEQIPWVSCPQGTSQQGLMSIYLGLASQRELMNRWNQILLCLKGDSLCFRFLGTLNSDWTSTLGGGILQMLVRSILR